MQFGHHCEILWNNHNVSKRVEIKIPSDHTVHHSVRSSDIDSVHESYEEATCLHGEALRSIMNINWQESYQYSKENISNVYKTIVPFPTYHFSKKLLKKQQPHMLLNFLKIIRCFTITLYFNTVDHTILLIKFERYGIRGKTHRWFESYLSNRSQYQVEYNNSNSDTKLITHGVPQGFILGPLLFIIYMNDFSRSSDLLFSILFADDTSVFIEGTSFTNISQILNTGLESVNICLKANKLTVNIKKTHYNIMMFHRTRIKLNTNFEIIIRPYK